MKSLKDLTSELLKAEAKDKFYLIEGTILRMLAPQHYTRPFIYKKKGWGQIERVEVIQDGSPQDLRAPQKRRKVRKGEEEVKISDCWTFKVENDTILLPWGDEFGIFKKSLRRSLEAQRRLKYESAPLSLMRVYPTWLPVGKPPCESQKDGRLPEIILETRHSQGKDVMVEVFFDYIENRPFQCIVEVDSEAPLNEEKFVALVKSLNTLDNIGPAKRGKIRINKIVVVEPSQKELEDMLKGEPVMPVIY